LNIIYELFCQTEILSAKVAGGDANATVFFLKPRVFLPVALWPLLLYEHCVC
jgi:hypothetical protein